MATQIPRQITIIGVGLIGGSFALALRAAGCSIRFVGAGRSQATLERGVERGIIDSWTTSLAESVSGSDVVLLAVPVGSIDSTMAEIAPALDRDTIVTDVGSVKQSVIEAARRRLPDFSSFVPAHPIAGTEHSGVEAGFATLYQNKRLILTPETDTSEQALEVVAQLWQLTGAVIEQMEPQRHDEVFAATSHLPHLLAFSLVETLYRMDSDAPLLQHTGGGFADYTRIASSDPVMWRDICLYNREALLATLGEYKQGLDAVAAAIENGEGEILQQIFTTAKETRDNKVLSVDKSGDEDS